MSVIVPQSIQGTLVAMRLRISALLAIVFALVLAGTGAVGPVEAGSSSSKPKVVRLLAVGDIACDPNSSNIKRPGYCQHDRVGALVKRLVKRGANSFVTLGDAQYETARFEAFRAEFHPAFRDVRSVTKAVAGNHEYNADGARGHFRYWGKRAGTPKQP